MTELHLWQRQHHGDVVAEVTPVHGMGTWAVCAFQQPGRQYLQQGRRYGLLTEAHAAADALAAASFDHVCEPACGVWQPIERRDPLRAPTTTPRRRATD